MGIQYLFNLMSATNGEAAVIKEYHGQLDSQFFLVDFNADIHPARASVISRLDKMLRAALASAGGRKHPADLVAFAKEHRFQLRGDADQIGQAFQDHFSDAYVSKMIGDQVLGDLRNKIEQFFQPGCLKLIYLAIDGVPSKGKMEEQRQRRYMGTVMSSYPAKLFQEVYQEESPEMERLFFQYRVILNTTKITPGTQFMEELGARIRELPPDFFPTQPKAKLVLSDVHECGEGEYKIVKLIRLHQFQPTDGIVVSSPDADMIILMMILYPGTTIHILRFDQELTKSEGRPITGLIMIDGMRDAFFAFVDRISPGQYLLDRVCDDLAVAFTIFGNDFIPKVTTLGSNNDLIRIMNVYLETLQQAGRKQFYLVCRDSRNPGRSRISFTFLKKFVEGLLSLEDEFLASYPLMQALGPYNASAIMDIFHPSIAPFDLRATQNHASEFFGWYTRLKSAITRERDVSEFECDSIRMEQLLVALAKVPGINRNGTPAETIQYLVDRYQTLLQEDEDYLAETGSPKKPAADRRMPMLRYSTRAPPVGVRINRHRTALEEAETPFQRESYLFENMLEEYHTILGVTAMKWDRESLSRYYRDHFQSTTTHDRRGKLGPDGMVIMRKYTEAMLWVFDYYFNGDVLPATWSYQYERAPLLRDLYQYLQMIDKRTITEIHRNLAQYRVTDLTQFFNPVEQYVYACPMSASNLLELPKDYRKFFRSSKGKAFLSKYDLDLDLVVDDLLSRREDPHPATTVECGDASYISKCSLLQLQHFDAQQDQEFLQELRAGVQKSKITLALERNEVPSFQFLKKFR